MRRHASVGCSLEGSVSGGISFDADAFEVSSELELWLGVDVEDEVLGCSRAGPCWTQENLECGTLLRLKQDEKIN